MMKTLPLFLLVAISTFKTSYATFSPRSEEIIDMAGAVSLSSSEGNFEPARVIGRQALGDVAVAIEVPLTTEDDVLEVWILLQACGGGQNSSGGVSCGEYAPGVGMECDTGSSLFAGRFLLTNTTSDGVCEGCGILEAYHGVRLPWGQPRWTMIDFPRVAVLEDGYNDDYGGFSDLISFLGNVSEDAGRGKVVARVDITSGLRAVAGLRAVSDCEMWSVEMNAWTQVLHVDDVRKVHLGEPETLEKMYQVFGRQLEERNGTTSLLPGSATTEISSAWTVGAIRYVATSTTVAQSCAVSTQGRLYCWGEDPVFTGHVAEVGSDDFSIGDDETPASFGFVQLGEAVMDVSVGGGSTCALFYSLRAVCWPDASSSGWYPGDGPQEVEYAPRVRLTNDPFDDLGLRIVEIVSGGFTTCALAHNGSVLCWGDSDDGQTGIPGVFGLGSNRPQFQAGFVNVGESVKSLAIGTDHVCAILDAPSSPVRCWGNGASGALGLGSTDDVGDDEVPADVAVVPISNDTTWETARIYAGNEKSCALSTFGELRCWGSGQSSALGLGSGESFGDDELASEPPSLQVAGEVAHVSIGTDHSCVLTRDGFVTTFGSGANGRLGYGDTDTVKTPLEKGFVAVGGGRVIHVACGLQSSCATLEGGGVRCWGSQYGGVLGLALGIGGDDDGVSSFSVGDNENPSESGDITYTHPLFSAVGGAVAISRSQVVKTSVLQSPFTSVTRVTRNGTVQPATNHAPYPIKLVGSGNLVVAMFSDGGLKSYSNTNFGSAGRGHLDAISTTALPFETLPPIDLGGRRAVDVAAGQRNGMALLEGRREVVVWGYDEEGLLGVEGVEEPIGDDETPANMSSIRFHNTISEICLGRYAAVVLDETGQVFTWGNGAEGTPGFGSSSIRAIANPDNPIPAGPVEHISCSQYRTCLQLKNQTVTCLGYNGEFDIGYPDRRDAADTTLGDDPSEVPSLLGGLNIPTDWNVIDVAVGGAVCVRIEQGDGSLELRCWTKEYGLLGVGNRTLFIRDPANSLPVPLSGEPALVAVGPRVACAVLLPDRLRVQCWGDDNFYGLGIGEKITIGFKNVPADFSPLTFPSPVLDIVAGSDHFSVLLEDGRIYGWGLNFFGAIGDGTDTDAKTPTRSRIDQEYSVGLYSSPVKIIEEASSTLSLASAPSHFPTNRFFLNLDMSEMGPTLPPEIAEATLSDISTSFFGSSMVDRSFCAFSGMTELLGTRVCEVPSINSHGTALAAGIFYASLTNTKPTQAILSTTGGDTLTLEGDISWIALFGPLEVTVGGRECEDVVVESGLKSVTCVAPAGIGKDKTIDVTIPSNVPESLEMEWANLTMSYEVPIVDVVVPDTGIDPRGGEEIRIQGSGFGTLAVHGTAHPSTDTLYVTVDGVDCSNVRVSSDAQIHCTMPAGIGAQRSLIVTVAGQSSSPVLLDSMVPQITSITPTYALAGASSKIALNGTGFPLTNTHCSVLVGGLECDGIEIVEPGIALTCVVKATLGWISGEEQSLIVSVAGQSSGVTRGLFTGVALPFLSSAVIDGTAPTSGGGIVRVVGEGFGLHAADIEKVVVDGVEVGEWVWGALQLVVTLPPGLGDVSLFVRNAVGGTSNELTISYSAPTLLSIHPSYALGGGLASGLDGFVVNGSGFGLDADDFDGVWLGGVLCESIEVISPGSSIRCRHLNTTNGFPSPSTAALSVQGRSTGEVAGLFRTIPTPTINAIAAETSLPTSGGTVVRIAADGLGEAATDIRAIHIGSDVEVTSFVWNALQLQFTLPPGTGSVMVWLENALGATSEAVMMTYDAPVVEFIEPDVSFLGEHVQTYAICGSNFAPSPTPSALLSASIGGWDASGARAVNTSCMEAVMNFPAVSTLAAWPAPDTIAVDVDGLSTSTRGILTTLPLPQITDITPTLVSEGTEVSLIGSSFGRSLNDVLQVVVGNSTCASLSFVSSSLLRCVIPFGALTGSFASSEVVDFSVCNRFAACSDASSVAIAGRGDVSIPVTDPWDVEGFREVGKPEVVIMTWKWLSQVQEDALIDAGSTGAFSTATQFILQLSLSPTFPTSTNTIEEVVDADQTEAIIQVFSRAPYFVRIAAVTAEGGRSNFSVAPNPAHESCEAFEYLQTNKKDLSDQVCVLCAEDRSVCGGLPAANVTAKQGYWRVPWVSSNSLSFAACKVREACNGWEESQPRSENQDFTSNRTYDRVAVPGLQLQPSRYESCADGFEGTLCHNCRIGYYREVTGSCLPCGDPMLIAARLSGIALFLLFLLTGLIIRAVIQAGSGSRAEVILARVMLNHFQGIGVLAAADVRWPIAVRDFFGVLDSTSTVSATGVSLECVMGVSGKNPILFSAMTVYVLPAVLIMFGCAFWYLFSITPRPPLVSIPDSLVSISLGSKIQITFLVLALLLHTTVTKAAFRLVTCETIAPIGEEDNAKVAQRRLVENLDYSCSDPNVQKGILGVALPALLIYSIGFPLFLIAKLSWSRYLLSTPSFRRIWLFSYAGYRKERAYWEGLILLRKVLLAAVTIFLGTSGPVVQLSSGLAVITAALVIHAAAKPFEEDDHQFLELSALVVAYITILSGLFLAAATEAARTTAGLVITIIVIATNVALVVATIILVIRRSTMTYTTSSSKLPGTSPPTPIVPTSTSSSGALSFTASNPSLRRTRTPKTATVV